MKKQTILDYNVKIFNLLKIKRRQESWGTEKIMQHTFRNIEFIYIHHKTVSHFVHGSQKRNNTLMALYCYQHCLCCSRETLIFSPSKDLRLRFQKVILPLIFMFKKMGKFWNKGQRGDGGGTAPNTSLTTPPPLQKTLNVIGGGCQRLFLFEMCLVTWIKQISRCERHQVEIFTTETWKTESFITGCWLT